MTFTIPSPRVPSARTLFLGALALFILTGSYLNQGTLAAFTASKTNATSTITTATLTLDATPNGGANGGVINSAISDFTPGDYILKGVAVRNTGSLDANLTLRVTDANPGGVASDGTLIGTSATDALRLTVLQCTDATYTDAVCTTAVSINGTAASNATTGSVLSNGTDAQLSGAMALNKSGGATDTRYFRIRVELPSGASDAVQAKAAALAFNWVVQQSSTGTNRG